MIDGLKSYSKYKGSGVPWLGEVPEHWAIRRLKRVCRLTYGDALASEARQPGDVPVYGSNGMVGCHSVPNTQAPCIVIGRKGSFGKVNFSAEPVFAIDTTYYVDSLTSSADIRWLYYLLGWLRLDEVSKDSAIPGLDREDAHRELAPVPSLLEQAAIARFLDHADRRIRLYIRAKQKLIKLLEEQKQAIIHRAVTGQIDVRTGKPHPAYKPSGVEWLGDVPEHWEVVPLRRRWSVTDCKHLTVPFVEEGIPLASVREVQSFDLRLDNAKRTTEDWHRLLIEGKRQPRRGDLIYCRNVSVGAAAVVETDKPLAMGQDVCLIRSNDQNQRFLNYFLHSSAMRRQLALLMVGSTFDRINVAEIKGLLVVVPPRDEQDQVAEYLDRDLVRLDQTVAKARSEQDLLREYRTRLIADVVTGKLDVREAAVRLPDEPADDDTEPLDQPDVDRTDEDEATCDASDVPEEVEA